MPIRKQAKQHCQEAATSSQAASQKGVLYGSSCSTSRGWEGEIGTGMQPAQRGERTQKNSD